MISKLFILFGSIFYLISTLGIYRFRSLFPKFHAAGISDTVAIAFIIMGLIGHVGMNFLSIKLLIILGMLFIINPTVTHIIAKSAYLTRKEK